MCLPSYQCFDIFSRTYHLSSYPVASVTVNYNNLFYSSLVNHTVISLSLDSPYVCLRSGSGPFSRPAAAETQTHFEEEKKNLQLSISEVSVWSLVSVRLTKVKLHPLP